MKSADFIEKAEEMRRLAAQFTHAKIRESFEELAVRCDLIAVEWGRVETQYVGLIAELINHDDVDGNCDSAEH